MHVFPPNAGMCTTEIWFSCNVQSIRSFLEQFLSQFLLAVNKSNTAIMPTEIVAGKQRAVVTVDLLDSDSDDENDVSGPVDPDWRYRVTTNLARGAKVKLEPAFDVAAESKKRISVISPPDASKPLRTLPLLLVYASHIFFLSYAHSAVLPPLLSDLQLARKKPLQKNGNNFL